MRLFGTDGIRGIVGEELTAELATSVGKALGYVLSEKCRYTPKVVIGTDTRISSEMLSSAIKAGLYSVGANAIDLKVAPTPAVAYLTVKNEADAGIVISASHNPYKYNGIKIFGRDGFKISDETEERIEALVLDGEQIKDIPTVEDFGRNCDAAFEMEDYIKHIVDSGVRIDGVRIGIDAANGSCYESARRIFDSLGGECYFISTSPNGKNINEGCGSTDLYALKNKVKKESLDLGIAFDGDGDRVLAVDKNGEEIDGDFIMAILAKRLKMEGKLYKNGVVGTVMTNMGFVKFCEKEGIKFYASKVGDRYVLELMEQEGLVFGGEQSGHIISREHATTGDGQLTAVLLLRELVESSSSLSALSTIMKKYPQYSTEIPADKNAKLALSVDKEIRKIIDEAEKSIPDGRLVVRASGTEPLIRIMTESENEEIARSVAEKLKSDISKRLSELN